MMPIRRGDGTGLSVPGFSEVRKGDGAVLWSAGGDIPDGGLSHRYDASQLTGSQGSDVNSLPDSEQNDDLTVNAGQTTLKTDAQNNLNVVRLDGDDGLIASGVSVSQPFHVFIVFRLNSVSTSANEHIIAAESTDVRFLNESGVYRAESGSILRGGTPDTNYHIASLLFNGANSVVRIDGSDLLSGDLGTLSLGGFRVGEFYDGGFFADMEFGEGLIYDADKTSEQSDIESALNDKWAVY